MTAKKKTTKARAKAKKATESVIRTICTEMKIEARVARRRLRAAGLNAPYTDAAAIRKALTQAAAE